MRGTVAIFGLLWCAASGASAADAPPICADRPGKATSTCTAPLGHWQLETGLADWTVQKQDGERDTLLVLGETTVKYGISDSADIEIDVTPWQRATADHASAAGFGDLNLIYKQQLTAPDAAPHFSFYGFVKIPAANRELGNRKVEGGVALPVSFAMADSPLSVALTPELDWAADEDGHGHHAAMAQVISLGWQANERLNLSGELWGQWDWDPMGTTRQASADAAAAYLISNDVQLDFGANLGLNRNTPDVELYGGVSKRF